MDLFGPFWACGDPFSAVLARFSPEASLGGSPKAQMVLKWPKIAQKGPATPVHRVRRGYSRSPPDNCQLPTNNRQPPSTAYRRQPPTVIHQQLPTANRHQPPTDNQARWASKRLKMETVLDSWRGSNRHFWSHFGPISIRFQPLWPILAQFPGLLRP